MNVISPPSGVCCTLLYACSVAGAGACIITFTLSLFHRGGGSSRPCSGLGAKVVACKVVATFGKQKVVTKGCYLPFLAGYRKGEKPKPFPCKVVTKVVTYSPNAIPIACNSLVSSVRILSLVCSFIWWSLFCSLDI